MNRLKPWIIAALAAALTLSIIGVASAQPTPPSLFTGTVSNADGTPAAAGLSVEAFIGDTDCTESPVVTTSQGGETTYFVAVANSSTKAGCGGSESVVDFRIGGQPTTPGNNGRGSGYVRLNLTLGPETVTVQVAVWRLISDPSRLFLSTRPAGGTWTTWNDDLDMSGVSSSGSFNVSDFRLVDVELADGSTVTVQVAVWRLISDPSRLFLSTRPAGGTWTTWNNDLDMSGVSSSGSFNVSDFRLVDVELE